ncbi:hypothetical protein CA12_33090 [Alienimonas californiensis]|uniref:DUF1583 domain-containing protein n=2 Tax=Alienimonas californiensis TaxID=2527989 RepID=A0A517PCT9_9PLAN|nr:hypothetical protein CA12_33090 [Alienimonas californiensis]
MFAAVGDFEVTVGFELRDVRMPSDGYGSGVGVQVTPRGGADRIVYLGRVRHPGEGDVWKAVHRTSRGGRREHDHRYVKTDARSGRLQLVREGGMIRCLAAGDDGEFHEVAAFAFGDDGIREISVIADTGGGTNRTKVAITELSVLADGLPYGLPPEEGVSTWTIWAVAFTAGAGLLAIGAIDRWRGARTIGRA